MSFRITPMPTETVRALQAGGPDANGQTPERTVSDGTANPCRHCLQDIPEGHEMLILAHRPFGALQPYAECGPIFLCAEACEAWQGAPGELPPILRDRADYLVKGYLPSERIAYGTGATIPSAEVAARIDAIFARDDIGFVDIRSSRNNCFQARAVRA